MNPPILIAIGVLLLIAIVDVWVSRLTTGAKVLWSLTILFLFGVGVAAWIIVRGTAYQDLEEIPGA